MAQEIGAFEKHGLKSELVYISSGSITVQAMVGGNLDMSVAASNAVVSSILRGAPLVAVGSITNRPAMSLFVQSEISRPDQLQGKALAITRHGSSTHFLTLFALEKLGLKDKVKIQPMGGTREVDAAVRTGMVAGAVRSMKPGPKTHMLVDLPDLGIPFSMDLIAVKRDFYKNSPRTVEGMLKAYIEGVAALKAKGFDSPYLKNYVVARVNFLRFKKDTSGLDFHDTIEELRAKTKKIDPGTVKKEDLAKMGGAPAESSEE